MGAPSREAEQHTSPKPVIESDRVEGTKVYDSRGKHVGSISEKVTGRVIYAVMSFGGFMGFATIPSEKLRDDATENRHYTGAAAPWRRRNLVGALSLVRRKVTTTGVTWGV